MTLLLDTHLLLWTAAQSARLPADVRVQLEKPDQQRWFSVASIWEISIKHALGRHAIDVEPWQLRRGLIENGWRELEVSGEHALATANLPLLHKDPFDRMLVAQAQVEGLTLLTSDRRVAQYPGPMRLV